MTPEEVLKQTFGYDSFRPGQRELIDGLLAGRDVLAVMPTGAGKSLCYQVPALLLPGITLVVSPLISLMQDQVQTLNAAGVHAAYINSSLSEQQVGAALRLAAEGRYSLIYAAPERLNTERFLAFAVRAGISMVTVDEAHCISQWGQDFRPSYLEIPAFVRRLPKRPVLGAFTATATREVREDIACVLGLADPLVQVSGFDRPNLSFQVETPKRKMDYVLQYVREHAGESGIIYCATRKNTEEVFEKLFRAGVSAAKYHAGMDAEERKRSQEDFVYDRAAVMVATNAFGMGIDKSNVRYVLHYNMPLCMENYYQEAGRAGRDGLPADCTLLFSPRDVMTARYLLENKDFSGIDPVDAETIRERDHRRLAQMEAYAGTSECLRKHILRYFGETLSGDCGSCGNCRKEFRECDRTEEAKKILDCVAEARGRFGMSIITGTLAGARRARITEVGADGWKSYGALKSFGEVSVKELTAELVRRDILRLTGDRYPVLHFGSRAAELKNPEARVIVREAKEKAAPPAGRKISARGKDALTSAGYRLFERLRALRREIAAEEGIPPYIVFGDKTLIEMCVRLPKTRTDLLKVSGVGSRKLDKYGDRFLEIIKEEDNKNGI